MSGVHRLLLPTDLVDDTNDEICWCVRSEGVQPLLCGRCDATDFESASAVGALVFDEGCVGGPGGVAD